MVEMQRILIYKNLEPCVRMSDVNKLIDMFWNKRFVTKEEMYELSFYLLYQNHILFKVIPFTEPKLTVVKYIDHSDYVRAITKSLENLIIHDKFSFENKITYYLILYKEFFIDQTCQTFYFI